jgi:hypothetical protein
MRRTAVGDGRVEQLTDRRPWYGFLLGEMCNLGLGRRSHLRGEREGVAVRRGIEVSG